MALVFDAGPDDRVFDSLLLGGLLLVVAISVLGRSIVTTVAASGYVGAFILYVLYLAVR